MRTPGGLDDRPGTTAPEASPPGRGPYGRSSPYGRTKPYGRAELDGRDQPDDPPGAGERVGNRRGLLLGAGLVAALALTSGVAYRCGADQVTAPVGLPTPTPSASATPPTTAEIYAAVAPSVVSIVAQDADGAGGSGSGTGVIVNADAMILTALHVVNGATTVRVTFADGTQVAANVVGADPAMDVAVLEPMGLPSVLVPAVLGSAGRLAVGDPVIAIGDQLGLTRTTTEGVVSGLDRAADGLGGVRISGLIQFDAAVNHGSSGGPLVNAAGETIGIVVALANPTTDGTFIGIGFAVPIGTAVTAGGGPEVPQ